MWFIDQAQAHLLRSNSNQTKVEVLDYEKGFPKNQNSNIRFHPFENSQPPYNFQEFQIDAHNFENCQGTLTMSMFDGESRNTRPPPKSQIIPTIYKLFHSFYV